MNNSKKIVWSRKAIALLLVGLVSLLVFLAWPIHPLSGELALAAEIREVLDECAADNNVIHERHVASLVARTREYVAKSIPPQKRPRILRYWNREDLRETLQSLCEIERHSLSPSAESKTARRLNSEH